MESRDQSGDSSHNVGVLSGDRLADSYLKPDRCCGESNVLSVAGPTYQRSQALAETLTSSRRAVTVNSELVELLS